MTLGFEPQGKSPATPMGSSPWTKGNVAMLLVVLVAAAALRYYGLSNTDNTDEYNEVFEALRVASGRFNVNRWHKKGFQNILAVEYGVYFVVGYVAGLWRSTMDFAATIINDMQPLFLIGRYTTATMGTASVVLVYWIGCRLYNPRVGLIASALLASCTMHVWTSHLVNTDIPLTFFFLLTLVFIVRFVSSGTRQDYCLGAIFAAVTVNIKIIGVGILIIYGLAYLQARLREGLTWVQALTDKELRYAVLCFAGGLLASNPAILVGFKQWLMYFVWQYGIYTNVYDEVPYAMEDNGFYTYAILLYKEFGPLLTLLSVGALVMAAVKRTNWDLTFLAFLIIMYGILGGTTFLVQNRYLMTLVPVTFLLVGRLVDAGVSRMGTFQVPAMIGIVAASATLPFYQAVIQTRSLTGENTSVISRQWIERHIPSGSKVLIDGGHTILTAGPRLQQSRDKLAQQLEVIRSLKEGQTYDSPQVKVVDSYAAIYFELLLKANPPITYDLTTTELGRQIEPLEYYLEQGYEYYVHNADYEDNLRDSNWRTKYPQSTRFFESLGTSLELVAAFTPDEYRSGPLIKVYRFPRRLVHGDAVGAAESV